MRRPSGCWASSLAGQGPFTQEEEWAQLGVLEAQQKPETEFSIRASMRLTAQKAFVRLDCGRRYAAALLRKSRPLSMEYRDGDWVMYHVTQRARKGPTPGAPGTEWAGPARILGFEQNVVWLQHGGVPIASALHLLRPATTGEMLACQMKAHWQRPVLEETLLGDGQQQGYLDHSKGQVHLSDRPERVPPLGFREVGDHISREEAAHPEAPLTALPPADGEGSVRPDVDEKGVSSPSSSSSSNGGEEPSVDRGTKRLREDPAPAASVRPVEAEEMLSPLERHLDAAGVSPEDPGRRLARMLRTQEASASSSAPSRIRSRSNERRTKDKGERTSLLAFVAALPVSVELTQALELFNDYQGFFAQRVPSRAAKTYLTARRKKENLEKNGKLLMYHKLTPELKKLVDEARLKEWTNYLKFNAVKVISQSEADALVRDHDAEVLPTQWIDVDKNEFKRREGGVQVDPKMKSRLVARGDLSTQFGRADSPTADKEAVFLVLSFASSRGLKICSGDLDHGYFQGERLSKPLLLKPPKGGLPDSSIQESDRLLAFVPIYGTKDAGRGLWRRVRRVMLEQGFHENLVMNALYSYTRNGKLEALVATHVDDLIWAASGEAEKALSGMKSELSFGTEEDTEFRFCGIEVKQFPDFSIQVSCEQTTMKLNAIRLSATRRAQLDSPVEPHELEQLMSVVGSLTWISRSCRPDIACSVSKLQTTMRKAIVSDLLFANKVVRTVQEDPKTGLMFRPGLSWDQGKLSILAISDASHGGEEDYLDDWEEREAFRSQGATLIFLANVDSSGNSARVHLVSYASSVQKRVVNSTIKAETYQLTDVVETADMVRATVADAHVPLDPSEWETQAAAWMTSLWLTDCRSCYDTLQKPVAKTVNKRLGIELAALRQHLWRASGAQKPAHRTLEERPPKATDSVRWVDTAIMLADPLTKLMSCILLMSVIASNLYDWTQPEHAKAIKIQKQAQRKKATKEPSDDGAA